MRQLGLMDGMDDKNSSKLLSHTLDTTRNFLIELADVSSKGMLNHLLKGCTVFCLDLPMENVFVVHDAYTICLLENFCAFHVAIPI